MNLKPKTTNMTSTKTISMTAETFKKPKQEAQEARRN